MASHWGIIQPIRGCSQFPYAAGCLAIPPARSAKINLTIKAIRLEKSILDIKAPRRPFHQGPQGYHLQVTGSATHAASNIDIAHTQIQILISLGYQSHFRGFLTTHLLPGKHPARISQILLLGA